MEILTNYFGELVGLQHRPSNFPQNRVTDHCFGVKASNLESILDGNLDPLLKPKG